MSDGKFYSSATYSIPLAALPMLGSEATLFTVPAGAIYRGMDWSADKVTWHFDEPADPPSITLGIGPA